MLLARNTTPDRLKAVAYIEQAVAVLEDHADDRDEQGEVSLVATPSRRLKP
jgi:hypothetical protein